MGNVNQVMRRVRMYQDMANTLEELDKITVCAVDGWCVGGGLEITMAADFVVATHRARWGMPEIDWGITPGWGGTTRMAWLIGRRMTKEVNLLGASFHPAQRALELGLFNRVVDDDRLDAEGEALIDILLSKNQQGLRQLKFMINRNVEADLYTAQGFEALGAALTGSILDGGGLPDSDPSHGWQSYRSDDPASTGALAPPSAATSGPPPRRPSTTPPPNAHRAHEASQLRIRLTNDGRSCARCATGAQDAHDVPTSVSVMRTHQPAWRIPRWPTAPRRPMQPTHPMQSTQSTHPTQATHRRQRTHANVATYWPDRDAEDRQSAPGDSGAPGRRDAAGDQGAPRRRRAPRPRHCLRSWRTPRPALPAVAALPRPRRCLSSRRC